MSDYQPNRKPSKRLADSATSQLVASDNGPGDIPPALAAALAEAETRLAGRDGVYRILQETHNSIPDLLRRRMSLETDLSRAEVTGAGTAEIQARVAEVETSLAQARRRRQGASSTLLSDDRCGQGSMLRAKETVAAARTEYTQAIVAEHRRKYDLAVAELQRLWREGDELAAAMRTTIETPVPARVSVHPVHVGEVERVPGASTVPAALPPGVVRVREVLDRLDQAIAVCGGISRTHELSGILGKRQSIGLSESAMADTSGTYYVVDTIRNGVDQMEHVKGDLVDAELLGGAGAMQRAIVGRLVRRADSFAVVAGAA